VIKITIENIENITIPLIQEIATIRNSIREDKKEDALTSLDYLRMRLEYLQGFIDGLLYKQT